MFNDHDRRPRSNRPRGNRRPRGPRSISFRGFSLRGLSAPMLGVVLMAPLLVGCPGQRAANRSHFIDLNSQHHASTRTREYMKTWNATLDQRAAKHFAKSGDVEDAIDRALAESDDLREALAGHIRGDRMGSGPGAALLATVEGYSRERLRDVLPQLATAEE